MSRMGISVVEHPKGSGTLYLLVCHNYQKRYIKVGLNSSSTLAIANRKKAEIEKKLALEGNQILSRILDNKAPTVKQYLIGWEDEKGDHPGWLKKAKKRLKYSTIKGYENILYQRIIPQWGHVPLDKILARDIDDFIDALSEEGLKPNSLSNIKNTFSAVLRQAVKDGYIKGNPAHGIEIPKPKDIVEPEPNPMTWLERYTLEKVIREHFPRYYALVATGFRAGLRIGELIGLRVGDIDFQRGIILVQNNITRSRETTPKSKSSRRTVRMSAELRDILKQQTKAVKEESLRRGWKGVPEWVFVNETGSSINYGNFIARVWNRAMEISGISRRTPHDMRHTYATLRLSAGHPVHEVAKELGHSTPVITYKVYYTFIPDISTSNIDEIDGKSSVEEIISTRELLENS